MNKIKIYNKINDTYTVILKGENPDSELSQKINLITNQQYTDKVKQRKWYNITHSELSTILQVENNYSLIDLFNIGMNRNFNKVLPNAIGTVLNIGPGEKHIAGALPLELPIWDAETDIIPYEDNSIDMIHCYHFLEHIENIHFVLSEIERVLKVGAHINIVVPYYKSAMQAQDLDHKHSFTEKTFKHLYSTKYYSKNKLKPMEVYTNFIMGESECNMCLVVQLRKLQ